MTAKNIYVATETYDKAVSIINYYDAKAKEMQKSHLNDDVPVKPMIWAEENAAKDLMHSIESMQNAEDEYTKAKKELEEAQKRMEKAQQKMEENTKELNKAKDKFNKVCDTEDMNVVLKEQRIKEIKERNYFDNDTPTKIR